MIGALADIVEAALKEARMRFVRGSGPGGQNVNKVATAVELRFDIAASRVLDPGTRERLTGLGGSRVSSGGILQIDARRFRTQEANRRDALARLEELLRSALHRPRTRTATRPTRASRVRRLERKRQQSELKQSRGRVRESD